MTDVFRSHLDRELEEEIRVRRIIIRSSKLEIFSLFEKLQFCGTTRR